MAYSKYYQQGRNHLQQAVELDRRLAADVESKDSGTGNGLDRSRRIQEVYDAYALALDNFELARNKTKNPEAHKAITDTMARVLPKAEYLSQLLQKLSSSSSSGNSGQLPLIPGTASNGVKEAQAEAGAERERLHAMLEYTICRKSPDVHWTDVVGLDDAKRIMNEAIELPRVAPKLFRGRRRPWHSILLYGPSGTGKTHLAKAVATECNVTFMNVSSSDLISKWVGESEKMVRALFELARMNQPTVIFIDEIDALCSKRDDAESESTRRVKNAFLVAMDGFDRSADERVILVGATNMPWAFDDPMKRRFDKKVYIGMPVEEARRRMLELWLRDIKHTLTAGDIAELAYRTQGFSASDMDALVKEAINWPIRRLTEATHFRPSLVMSEESHSSSSSSSPTSDPPTLDLPPPPDLSDEDDDSSECESSSGSSSSEQQEEEEEPFPMDSDYLEDDDELPEELGYVPCSADEPGAIAMRMVDVPDGCLIEPACTMKDFERSLAAMKPTVSPESLQRYAECEWNTI